MDQLLGPAKCFYQGNENKERVGGKIIITPTLFYVYDGEGGFLILYVSLTIGLE